MNSSRIIPILLAVLLTAGRVSAQTLLLDETSNRAFPQLLGVIGAGDPVSLLDPDPESSSWFFMIDGSLHSPSEQGWTVQKTREDDVTEYRVDSRALELVWRLSFSGDGRYARIVGTMTNNASETAAVRPLVLMDTWLGEKNGLPFELNDGTFVRTETLFSRPAVPEWIKTSRNSSTPHLVLFLDGPIATRPDSVVLGNWLRLRESMENLQIAEGRSFDYLPFSENDSAVFIALTEEKLSPGESATFTLLLGLDDRAPSSEDFDTAAKVTVDPAVQNRRLQEYTIGNRLEEIGAILEQIDDLLENGPGPGSPGLSELEQLVGEQEQLQREYENL